MYRSCRATLVVTHDGADTRPAHHLAAPREFPKKQLAQGYNKPVAPSNVCSREQQFSI